jgi:mxaJ protein
MSSRCRSAQAARGLLALIVALGATNFAAAEGRILRVCADPANLPYSDREERGFENRIARLVAAELGARLDYAWQPLGRGLVRKSLGADACDVLVGVPAGLERVLTTRPYYRSGYVFVNRTDSPQPLESFDDHRLRELRVGVQLIGNDLAATPPGHALARHGAAERVVGYPVFGDVPAAARAQADLAAGRIDAALLWGPQAGYFAARSAVPMRLSAARAPAGLEMPFAFAIAMGVRKDDRTLQAELDAVLARRAAAIAAILDEYGVPRWPLDDGAAGADAAPTGARP